MGKSDNPSSSKTNKKARYNFSLRFYSLRNCHFIKVSHKSLNIHSSHELSTDKAPSKYDKAEHYV